MDVSQSSNNLYLSQKKLQAIEFAALAHQNQKRKGPEAVPYVSHCAAVGLVLDKGGFADDVVIAGILHDVIEDTDYTYEDLQQRFGKVVADLVQSVSEDQSLRWPERMERYIDNLKGAAAETLAISAADMLSNRLDALMSLHEGRNLWDKFPGHAEKSIELGQKRLDVIKAGLDHPLVDELESVLQQIHQFFNKKQ